MCCATAVRDYFRPDSKKKKNICQYDKYDRSKILQEHKFLGPLGAVVSVSLWLDGDREANWLEAKRRIIQEF